MIAEFICPFHGCTSNADYLALEKTQIPKIYQTRIKMIKRIVNI